MNDHHSSARNYRKESLKYIFFFKSKIISLDFLKNKVINVISDRII